MTEDVVQMKIGKFRTGIIGLKAVCGALSGRYKNMGDAEIKDALMTSLEKTNYIPENVRNDYEQAFFKAFKAFVGEPIPETSGPGGLEIKVLGQGCARCRQLEQDVMTVLSEMNVQADVEHVTEIEDIASYGVLGLPGLVINGTVVIAGSIPSKAKIKEWVSAAGTNSSQ
jgi:small redox-active disulfide protein 2